MTNELENSKTINPYIIAITVLIPSFLALVATSATNVCQPNIAGYFGATQYEANTVITCYMISNGVMIPITGYLGRRFGVKNFLIWCIELFLIGSLMCIFAPNLQTLILSRIVQGIGGGSILPLGQAVLLGTFPIEKRGMAMGLFGIAAMFSPLIGPFLGGYLTDNFSWKWVFILNIPLSLLSLLLAHLFLNNSAPNPKKYDHRFDIIGFIAITIAMACMQIVLDKGQQYNWFNTPFICWLTGICIFAFIFFYVWELEYKNPVVDIRVFKNKNFLFGTLISSFINVITYSTLLLVPMFIQGFLGYSPQVSGFTMYPRAISCLLSLLVAGKIAQYIDHKVLCIVGLVTMGVSTFWLSELNLNSSIESVILPNIFICAGAAFAFVPITALSFKTLSESKNADAASLHALFKNIVTAIATALSATYISRVSQVHQNLLIHNLNPANPVLQTKLLQIKGAMLPHFAPYLAQKKALGYIYKELLKQAKLLSFHDAFCLLALICFVIIPLLVFVKSKKRID